MNLNLERYLNQELNTILGIFLGTWDWKQIDEFAVESKISFNGKNVFLAIYPELLTYTYRWYEGASVYKDGNNKRVQNITTPWIACKLELEGMHTANWHYDVLKELKKWLYDNLPIKPFKDEDACHQIYSRQCSAYIRDRTEYIFYLNIDYPNGWWENHTLG